MILLVCAVFLLSSSLGNASPAISNRVPKPHARNSSGERGLTLFNNVDRWMRSRPNDELWLLCGLYTASNQPVIGPLLNETYIIRNEITRDFCNQTVARLFPLFCKLRPHCVRNAYELDALIGLHFGKYQFQQERDEPLSCKDASGNEQTAHLINPDAYKPGFSDIRHLLNHPVPCPK